MSLWLAILLDSSFGTWAKHPWPSFRLAGWPFWLQLISWLLWSPWLVWFLFPGGSLLFSPHRDSARQLAGTLWFWPCGGLHHLRLRCNFPWPLSWVGTGPLAHWLVDNIPNRIYFISAGEVSNIIWTTSMVSSMAIFKPSFTRGPIFTQVLELHCHISSPPDSLTMHPQVPWIMGRSIWIICWIWDYEDLICYASLAVVTIKVSWWLSSVTFHAVTTVGYTSNLVGGFPVGSIYDIIGCERCIE